MINFNDYLLKSNIKNLKMLKLFYYKLKEAEYDPISIEFQMYSLKKEDILLINDDIKKISKEIIKIFPQTSLDEKEMILRVLPNDYKKILELFRNNEKLINELLANNNNDLNNQEEDKIIELASILEETYNNAPKGYQMTYVHLFGIRYCEELKSLPVKRISIMATGKENLWVEIGKGMKLHKYVKIID